MPNSFDANTARALTKTSLDVAIDWDLIYDTIRSAAKKGDSGTSISIMHIKESRIRNEAAKKIISKLKSEGYEVERSNGSDIRGDSWDTLAIYWNEPGK